MNKVLKVLILSMVLGFSLQAQDINGIWRSVDDEDGKSRSHILVEENEGILTATIVKLLEAAESDTCDRCKGDKKGKPIVGMSILSDMQAQKNGTYKGGNIFNPKNGKTYSCTISFKDNNTLKLRGFIGFSLIGKTQYWYRVK